VSRGGRQRITSLARKDAAELIRNPGAIFPAVLMVLGALFPGFLVVLGAPRRSATKAIPHFGHAPCDLERMSGCIGQT